MFSTLTSARHATEISLERQFFYTPPAAADPKLASRGFRAQEREPSVTISRVLSHPPLPQDMHNPQSGNTGKSQADAILIRSDNEFDLNGRSNISFKSLDGLLPDARNKVQSGRITGVGKGIDAAPDDNDTPEPSVTSIAGPGNESHTSPITVHAEQDRPVLVFPIPDPSPVCMRWSRIPVDRCPKHPNGSTFYRRFLKAKADDKGNKGDEPRPADAGLPLPPPNSQLEADYTTDKMCPATPPQVVQSWSRTPTLPDDESTSELEPADAEPRLQPQSPSGAASGHGVDPLHSHLFTPDDRGESVACSLTLPDDESTSELESADAELDLADAEPRLQPQSQCGTASSRGVGPRQRSGSSHLSQLSQHRGHRDDGDRTVAESDLPKPAADPHRRSQSPHSAASSPRVETQQWPDPSAQDDRWEQNEGFAAPPQAQESRESMPRSPVEGSNAPELARAEPSMQPSTGQDHANLQHDMGRHRQYSPDDGGVYSPVEDSVARHGQDDDVAQPPRKRRGIRNSSPTTHRTPVPQTRRHRASQAQRQTTKRPKPRRSQCLSDVPEDQGPQREGGSVAPPQAPDVRANAEPSMQPPASQVNASQVSVKRQRGLSRHRRCSTDDGEDYCPSVCSGTEHSEDDAVRPPRRKRRSDSSREARRLSRRPRRQRGSAHLSSPPEPTLERDAETDRSPAATFEEWPLGNAVLKRVTVDGAPTTFMLQFTWDPCAKHGRGHRGTENRVTVSSAKRRRPARQRSKGSTKDEDRPTPTSRRERYTPEDDAKIRQLKEQGLSWIAIAKHFPGRSAGAIEVRYHTKLKTADPSRSGSRQWSDHSRALSPVVGDDGREEEFPVEEICGDRGLDDGGLELLVKWKGGEETWEPYENVAETEALDEYERLYGPVTVYTV